MLKRLTEDEARLLRGIGHLDSNIAALYFDGPVLIDMIENHKEEQRRKIEARKQ